MPQNLFQRAIFALLTVFITVHAFVFFSIYVVNGSLFMEITHSSTVLQAINKMGGITMFNCKFPIWGVILVEFVLAFTLEMLLGSPSSFKLASKVFDIKSTHPVLFETAIICATAAIMCPAMSFLAAIMYYPSYDTFNFFTLLANFLKLVCYNFPFALLSQLFFIQPLVRTLFKLIFKKQLAKH